MLSFLFLFYFIMDIRKFISSFCFILHLTWNCCKNMYIYVKIYLIPFGFKYGSISITIQNSVFLPLSTSINFWSALLNYCTPTPSFKEIRMEIMLHNFFVLSLALHLIWTYLYLHILYIYIYIYTLQIWDLCVMLKDTYFLLTYLQTCIAIRFLVTEIFQ